MSAEQKDVPTKADVVSHKTLEELKSMVIPDDWTPPPPEPKLNRPMVWQGPAAEAAIKHSKTVLKK